MDDVIPDNSIVDVPYTIGAIDTTGAHIRDYYSYEVINKYEEAVKLLIEIGTLVSKQDSLRNECAKATAECGDSKKDSDSAKVRGLAITRYLENNEALELAMNRAVKFAINKLEGNNA